MERFDHLVLINERRHYNLQADCENCFGLCCIALHFSASEGFPIDKKAGQPCPNLQTDFRCGVHLDLRERGFKGCAAFDCIGAGQKVAQVSFGGQDWRQAPNSSEPMCEVFLVMQQLHELLWYLTEALMLQTDRSIQSALKSMLGETESLTHLSSAALIDLDLGVHRASVNALLLQTSQLVRTAASHERKTYSGRRRTLGRRVDLIGADLRNTDLKGADLRGAYLIAADLRSADMSGADLIGADLRDTDLRGADLTESIFLTQSQINVAKGDESTKLPPSLTRPAHWAIFEMFPS